MRVLIRSSGFAFHLPVRFCFFFLAAKVKSSICPPKQFGAQSEGDHAQSILGLLGGSVKGRSADLHTRHQTAR